ncbi:hypothetical protein D3C71_2046490 [compost metagenome]
MFATGQVEGVTPERAQMHGQARYEAAQGKQAENAVQVLSHSLASLAIESV